MEGKGMGAFPKKEWSRGQVEVNYAEDGLLKLGNWVLFGLEGITVD